MTEEKQKIISDICPFYKEYGSCEQCNTDLDIDDEPCYFECMANAIIANGYRKQSEGEWVKASNKPYVEIGMKCSLCGARIRNREFIHGNHKYCHKCGAKMKGGGE